MHMIVVAPGRYQIVKKLWILSSMFIFYLNSTFADFDAETGKAINLFAHSQREQWFSQDLQLLLPMPTSNQSGDWKLRKRETRSGLDLAVFERPDPSGDPNHLFYY